MLKSSERRDFKNNDLHSGIFDRVEPAPYYTRPMAAALPDLVDCAQLADEAAVLDRVFELSDFPRLKDVLAEQAGTVRASYAFTTLGAERLGAELRIEATPRLVCQRCMQDFGLYLAGSSEIEFTADEEPPSVAAEREFFRMRNGLVSLRELAEEELLLALPLAPACDTPLTCGRAPSYLSGELGDGAGAMRRPFGALQDLLKKT